MPAAHFIGCSIDELDTPVLCVDLDVLEANIARMAALCRQHGVGWRPHTKAMKTPELARRLIAAGALGVTCAKLGEAEVMADGGIREILIANQIVGPLKLRRLAELCRRADPIVALDHEDQVRAMGAAMHAAGVKVRMIVEIDIGLKRAGVAPGEAAVRLGQVAASTPGIELAGIMGYEGHLLTLENADEKARAIREAMALLVACRDDFLRAGLPCPIVSAGGTGSCAFTVACPGVTELQAGGLIFMDAFYRHKCQVTAFDFALKVLCTVVSRPAPGRAIIDAGRKTVHGDLHVPLVLERVAAAARVPGSERQRSPSSAAAQRSIPIAASSGINASASDRSASAGASLALRRSHPHILVTRLSAEHGELQLDEPARDLKIGDRLWLIPGYSDMTNVLHNEFHALRGDRLEAIWPLLSRGRVQ